MEKSCKHYRCESFGLFVDDSMQGVFDAKAKACTVGGTNGLLTITVGDQFSKPTSSRFMYCQSLECTAFRLNISPYTSAPRFFKDSKVVRNRYPNQLAMYNAPFTVMARWHEIRLCKIPCVCRKVQVGQASARTNRLKLEKDCQRRIIHGLTMLTSPTINTWR